jgi:hypothetical protein
MKKILFVFGIMVLIGAFTSVMAGAKNYGTVNLSGGFLTGHFDDVYDLTAGDITLSFTYDGNGLVDDAGAHAWAELGVRSLSSGSVDFNPYLRYTYPTKTVNLLAGKTYDSGDVTVSRVGDYLFVTYNTAEGCLLSKTHLAVGDALADIPQAKGNPIPGQFENRTVHEPPVPSFSYIIDATQWSASTLYIAAHAMVVCGAYQETAWGAGTRFSGKNWATYFTYTNTVATTQAGSGIWLATDYDWTTNTFDPDPVGKPSLDLDDKLILQRQGGIGEGAYNLPSVPPAPGNNHRFWWDRDGVDPWQNPATANTGGIYQIVITLHATGATAGTAYMKIRNLYQGFETNGNWNTIELTPAGMTFVGDMKHLQVFYGIYGYGATHSVSFKDITVTQ